MLPKVSFEKLCFIFDSFSLASFLSYSFNCFRRMGFPCSMDYCMLALGKGNKIFNPIIKTIAVNMMNTFCGLKRAPKMFFHDKTMFTIFFAFNVKTFITTVGRSASFFSSTYPKTTSSKFSIIMLKTKIFTKNWAIAFCNRARVILIKLSIIMFITKIFANNLFVAIVDRAYIFCFHWFIIQKDRCCVNV